MIVLFHIKLPSNGKLSFVLFIFLVCLFVSSAVTNCGLPNLYMANSLGSFSKSIYKKL